MAARLVATIGTGRIVPTLQRIEDDELGMTKFVLYFEEEVPPVLLLWAGLGEQADHAWAALELVAMAFAPDGEVFTSKAEREIAG